MNIDTARDAVIAAIKTVAPDTDPATVSDSEDVWYALDLDSMDQLNVMVSIGEQTGVQVPEVDYPRLETIGQLTSYLSEAIDEVVE